MHSATVFFVLSSVINNTLYINYPYNTDRCFITLNVNNATLQQKWPGDFKEMRKLDGTCAVPIESGHLLYFKVQYLVYNQYKLIDKIHTVIINSTALNNYMHLTETYLNTYKVSTILLGVCCVAFMLFIFLVLMHLKHRN